jgi:hypothetical protein
MAINYLDLDRLVLIPSRQRARHEFCFYLHDIMVGLLKEAEAHRVATVKYVFRDEVEKNAFKERNDPLAFFIENGRRDIAKQVALNQVSLALYADLLHFVCEALKALEKRKFTVAFTLLRKPLKQSLMFATWMRADDEDFFTQFERSPADHMEEKNLPKERQIELLERAIACIENPNLFNANLIYSIIFDKNSETGLAPLFDKATHLVTSRGRYMRTEELNFNFIFKNPQDNDIYETVYLGLGYVLMYLVLLQVSLYSRMCTVEKSFCDWVLLTSLGSYPSLFTKGRSPLVDMLNDNLTEFLICPHCRTPVKIRKSEAARFFITENLRCLHCSNDHHFPLFWLMSKLKLSFSGKTE